MAPEPLEGDGSRNRRARIAVAALFLTNGALFANLLPRYPEIKSDLAMSNAAYGGAVASFSAGALLAGLTAAVLIRRESTRRPSTSRSPSPTAPSPPPATSADDLAAPLELDLAVLTPVSPRRSGDSTRVQRHDLLRPF